MKIDPSAFGIPGLPAFLTVCMQKAKGDLSQDELAEILCAQATRLRLSEFASKLMKDLNDGRKSGEELALEGSAFLANMAAAQRPMVGISIHEAGQRAIKDQDQTLRNGTGRGHDWGIRALDDIMGRIVPGDFGLMIGPSGHGKSAKARGLANHIALRDPVLTISDEEMPEDIAIKDMIARTGVDSRNIEDGTLRPDDLEKLCAANMKQHGLQSYFEYTDDMRISNIEALILAFKHKHGRCGAVFIDTIDGVEPEERGVTGITEKVIVSCRKFDKLATKHGVAIIALGQVKTIYNDRPDISLRLSDSYGGQGVRNKASWVLLMHRPQKKIQDVLFKNASGDNERAKLKSQYEEWKDKAQFICAKRRRGRDGGVAVIGWDGPRTSFFDLDDMDQGNLYDAAF
ncbi:DnaB-like helicase C-terminal domain-containing protein [Roseibium sp. TrichSKD4]|uniref:DnaB-like helicase C-terminal domain-containing protein n=1 Tax=Roseibium sp. TrichSKD4 TaxID=744980 RepID=UPI0005906D20|nr:DnaB-like helicase C-terminal domain-containing protein [Roseibium sp. TrichSKD4]